VTGKIRKQVKAWLKSGVFDDNIFTKTEMGTPQGGVISPLLANIALHGMESELMESVKEIPIKLKGANNSKKYRVDNTNFIRYADDFVIMHYNKEFLGYCKGFINTWLNEIGLELKPEKTTMI
jgi:RNA-directed DNA polymerase